MKPTQLTSVVYPVSLNTQGQYVHTIRLFLVDEVGNVYVANPNDETGPKWVLNIPAPDSGEKQVAKKKDEPKEYVTNKPSPFGVDLKKKKVDLGKTETEGETK